MQTFALGTIVLNNDAGATDDLARVALSVDLAQTSPSAKDLGVTNLDEVDFVLSAESLNESEVLGLSTGLYEDAQVSLAFVESLGGFTETAGESVMDEGVLQDLLHNIKQFQQCARKLARDCDIPVEPPRQKAFLWVPRWKPRPQRGHRLEFHLQRQTSCVRSTRKHS
jgi:hypothetical protein